MKAKRLVSIIIPTLNEEATIGQILRGIPYRDLGEAEVLVIDGGSSDGTIEVAKALGATVISQSKPGYGQAILEGITHAKGDRLVLIDGDGVYDPRELPSLLKMMDMHDADLVIGSRFLGEIKPGAIPLMRSLMDELLTFILRIIIGKRITDFGSGFRVFKKESFKKLENELREPAQYSMIWSALSYDLKVVEAPVTFYPRSGKSKLTPLSAGFRILRLFLKTKIGGTK